MSDPIHSTGRGGAGNIGKDNTVYTDGGIVREGVAGESVDGAYSAGRGGAGNVSTPKQGATEGRRSQDIIPDINLRAEEGEYHTGRGGGGNVHREKSKERHAHGLGEKIKNLIHPSKDKEETK